MKEKHFRVITSSSVILMLLSRPRHVNWHNLKWDHFDTLSKVRYTLQDKEDSANEEFETHP